VSPSRTSPSAVEGDNLPDANRWAEVSGLLGDLYEIVDRLEELFSGRKFTLDGHLIGSIGEVIAAYMFGLDLLPGAYPEHDAKSEDGRKVQIKLTQSTRSIGLRAEPEHLLVLRLAPDRSVEVVYNGTGRSPWSQAGKMQKNGQRSISISRLRDLDASVLKHDRLVRLRSINLASRERP